MSRNRWKWYALSVVSFGVAAVHGTLAKFTRSVDANGAQRDGFGRGLDSTGLLPSGWKTVDWTITLGLIFLMYWGWYLGKRDD